MLEETLLGYALVRASTTNEASPGGIRRIETLSASRRAVTLPLAAYLWLDPTSLLVALFQTPDFRVYFCSADFIRVSQRGAPGLGSADQSGVDRSPAGAGRPG